jgi:hypothetical protein
MPEANSDMGCNHDCPLRHFAGRLVVGGTTQRGVVHAPGNGFNATRRSRELKQAHQLK